MRRRLEVAAPTRDEIGDDQHGEYADTVDEAADTPQRLHDAAPFAAIRRPPISTGSPAAAKA